MCFSTTASFAAGVLLSSIGIISIKKTKEPKEIPFAAIPLVFGLQQFSEGFVWLSLVNSNNVYLQELSCTWFLLFALIIWPSLIPFSIYLLEKQATRKRILKLISIMGFVFSLLSVYYLIKFDSKASITSYHIHYDLSVPYNSLAVFGILYLIPPVISHFISSVKLVPLMGGMVFLSYFISRYFFDDMVLSVWCFFSAVISIMIYIILRRKGAN